jgi:16S rRNA (guanine527-N7)-methyltransferase
MSSPVDRSVERRIEALGSQYRLAPSAISGLGLLIKLLADDPHAPTSVRDPVIAVDVHLADSLSALQLPELRDARAIADLGAGAGFPGLVLALARPEAIVALVESVGRKAAFIERAAAEAGVANVAIVPLRAEDWPAGAGAHDVVTARALAPLAILAEYAAPLLRIDGVLVAWKGRRDDQEEQAGAVAAAELGLAVDRIVPVRPYPAACHHHLHVLRKIAPTPSRFPRRPGVARKRPLGGQAVTSPHTGPTRD